MMKLIDKSKIDFTTIEPYEYASEELEVAFKEDIEGLPEVEAIPLDKVKQARGEIQKRATLAMAERYKQGLRTALEIIDRIIKEYESESE